MHPFPPPPNHWSERAGRYGFLVFFVIMGCIMAPRVSNIAGGADPSCYLELNRLIMRGDFSPPLRAVADLPLETYAPGVYAPISYEPRPDYSALIPTGFPGLPLVYSAFDLILPTPWAVGTVVWLTLMGCGVLVYLLLRELGFAWAWACLGGITMGISPLTVFIGTVPLTDPLTCCLATACWILALRADRGWAWAAALGFTLGLAVLTRAPNILAFLPTGIVLLARGWRRVPWIRIALGGLPAVVFLVAYNLHVHGHPVTTTGYANFAELFKVEQLTASLAHYAKWLAVLYPVAVLAPLSLLLVRRHPAVVAVSWTWVVVYVGFYGFYFASSENWYILRYIMPAAVALIVVAILVLRDAEAWLVRTRPFRWAVGVLPVTLALAAVAHGAWQGDRLSAYIFRRNESNILEIVAWLETSTRREDVFLCTQFTGSMYYYTDRSFLRHERLDAAGWDRLLEATRGDGREVYGVFYVFEFHDSAGVQGRFPGTWEKIFHSRDEVIRVFRLIRPPAPAGT